VNSETVFHYRQKGDMIWGTYEGGLIRYGQIIGRIVEDDKIDFRYQHLNVEGEMMTGEGLCIPELLADGRLRLHESWKWTTGDGSSGKSVVEEVSR
jgi:hypothetical protein